jgi:uncharacterized protein DUF3352
VRRLLLLLALLGAAVAAAGCGSDKASGPAALAPAKAVFYAEATLAPEGEQKRAVESLIAKFPGSGSPGQRIQALLESVFRETRTGLSFEQDVKPWLGDKAAFFAGGPARDGDLQDGAFLIATNDEGKTNDALDRAGKGAKQRSYKGHDYRLITKPGVTRVYTDASDQVAAGVVKGFLVVGSEAGFKQAVDVADGDTSLDGADDFDQALADVPDDRLGFFYFNGKALVESANAVPDAFRASYRKIFKKPYAATLKADAAGFEFAAKLSRDAVAGFAPFLGEGTDFVGELPGDSWLALGQPEFGKALNRSIDLFAANLGGRDTIAKLLRNAAGLDLDRDVLGWMGDFGMFARGQRIRDLSAGVVIQTKDEAASGRALAALAKALKPLTNDLSIKPLSAPGGGKGFTMELGNGLKPIHFFQRDGKVVLAYGDEAARDALSPATKLADTPGFRDAASKLGAGFTVSAYLSVAPILALIENEVNDPGMAQVKPYLEPFKAVVGGSRLDGDDLESRSRITVH